MGKTELSEVYHYSMTVVAVFGIIGNTLVIISILKQKCLLRSNYYVLVLHLAICDLGVLIISRCDDIVWYWTKEPYLLHPVVSCVFSALLWLFGFAGVGMMLVISVLRYRGTVHPLIRPAISRRKLKVVCGFVYIVGFIVGFGISLPLCFVSLNSFYKFHIVATVYYFLPPIFMAVVYYKVGRALFKQSKHMKRLCHTDAVRKRYIRDRRTFLICLITVLCYGIGNLPVFASFIVLFAANYHSSQLSFQWFHLFSAILQVICSNAANPVIYGILDKQLRGFWKCRKLDTRRTQEPPVQQVGETSF